MNGGLLLTPQARDFYFVLQDLLRLISSFPDDWEVDRSDEYEGTQKDIFRNLRTARKTDKEIGEAINVFDYFNKGTFEDWQNEAPDLGEQWKRGINKLASDWKGLDNSDRFSTLQQVGSILRTSLGNDLESRLR